MLDFTLAQMSKITLHFVGNRIREEGYTLSSEDLQFENDIETLLLKYFLSPFSAEELYQFHHEGTLALNEVYTYATELFSDPDQFISIGHKIAQHLYKKSVHPKIKGGELCIVYFKECLLDDELVDCIGLFKSEHKDSFLRIFPEDRFFRIEHEKGIDIRKLDKGCLIFNSNQESGYICTIVENASRGDTTRYWTEEFLGMAPLKNDLFQSTQILQVVNGFVRENQKKFSSDESVAIKAKSLEFFQEHSTFNEHEFEKAVFEDLEKVVSFRDFKSDFEIAKGLEKIDHFEISQATKKKTLRILKSIIKLDKNFQIHVHGNPEKIEKGYDQEKGLSYYKLYFQEES